MSSRLFETTELNGMAIENRFVRSATWEGMAKDDGTCTPELSRLMVNLADGGVGLIISSHCYVHERGKATPGQLALYKDELIAPLSEMTGAVHDKGAKVVVQLAHAGIFASPDQEDLTPFGPSVVEGFTASLPLEMTESDIENVVDAFGLAARRAVQAGFDGIQIHAAHGYLLSQFLSPAFNKRSDSYGGSIENRTRILLEVIAGIRKSTGENYPLLIKMNSEDFLDNGLSLEDSCKTAVMLQKAGIDAIEISGGTLASGELNPSRTKILSTEKEAYFKEAAVLFKKNIHIPIILVGGIRSFEIAEQMVNDSVADYISMSRPFIREPGLINRWKAGDRSKATCISDLKCFEPAFSGEGIYCVVEQKRGG